MTEAELLAEVTAMCDRLGLLWHHDPDSRRVQGSPGFLDLVIAGTGGLLAAELKGEDGETSADQDMWLWVLGKAGQHAVVWGPADWRSGKIRSALEALAQQPT